MTILQLGSLVVRFLKRTSPSYKEESTQDCHIDLFVLLFFLSVDCEQITQPFQAELNRCFNL